jgi:prepilin-type N-terminal cleavage/methylation domain-containing protein
LNLFSNQDLCMKKSLQCHYSRVKTIIRIVSLPKNTRGFSLIEVVISIALLGILAAGFMGALGNASKSLAFTDERQTAKTIAEHQMEYVKEQGYLTSYTPDPTITSKYPGYSVITHTESVTSRDNNIQKIRVVVVNPNGKQILLTGNSTLEGYKVNQ